MKKIFKLIVLIITVITFTSCDKYCTCTTENNSTSQSIEIDPNENCSDYSKDNLTCY
jgi:hypothetical protein